jgi:hypothetical protein
LRSLSRTRTDDLSRLGRIGGSEPARGRRARRLGVRRAGTATVATRRPAIPRPVVVTLLVVVAALVYLGVVAAQQTADLTASGGSPNPTAPSQVVAEAPAEDRAAGPRAEVAQRDLARRPVTDRADRSARAVALGTPLFSRVDGLALHLPHREPIAVAFHEATRPEALALDPVGVLEANDNATKYIAPADADGPAYRVLFSRGRGRPATSAVDIAVPEGGRALAPVTGTVVDVRRYTLSRTVQDWRIVIEPAGRRDLQVVVIHLHEPAVAVGDRVTAGTTPLAVVRLLPFASHVDYVVGERHPHVHIEVKPATAEAPIDPNAPAVESVEILAGS